MEGVSYEYETELSCSRTVRIDVQPGRRNCPDDDAGHAYSGSSADNFADARDSDFAHDAGLGNANRSDIADGCSPDARAGEPTQSAARRDAAWWAADADPRCARRNIHPRRNVHSGCRAVHAVSGANDAFDTAGGAYDPVHAVDRTVNAVGGAHDTAHA